MRDIDKIDGKSRTDSDAIERIHPEKKEQMCECVYTIQMIHISCFTYMHTSSQQNCFR